MNKAVPATAPSGSEHRKVLRPFGGPGGRIYQVGEVIDTTGWRNARALAANGRLSEIISVNGG